MYIVLGILAAAALGGLVYIFLSPKSTKIQKMAALGALVLSGIVLAVCGVFIVYSGAAVEENPYAFVQAVEEAEPAAETNYTVLSLFLILLLAFFGFIIFMLFRDKKKRTQGGTPKAPADTAAFSLDHDNAFSSEGPLFTEKPLPKRSDDDFFD